MPHRAFDHLEVRCPQLGGEVTFGYCRKLDDGLPCSKALVCFELRFPVQEYFLRVLEAETFRRCFESAGPGRYERFLEVVSEARERVEED